MKDILISIQPQWVAMIVHKKKTLEIRKTMPKCDLPCKVYIYCSWGDMRTNYMLGKRGKVVAEFTLNDVERFDVPYPAYFYKVEKQLQHIVQGSCLPLTQIHHYLKNNSGYAWHIDNLKIYDTPKELSEFTHNVPDYTNGVLMYSIKKEPLKRPPQSWCYVEKE